MRIHLFSAMPWKLTDEGTGEVRQGYTVHGFSEDAYGPDERAFGQVPVEMTLMGDEVAKVSKDTIPGVWEIVQESITTGKDAQGKKKTRTRMVVCEYKGPFGSSMKPPAKAQGQG